MAALVVAAQVVASALVSTAVAQAAVAALVVRAAQAAWLALPVVAASAFTALNVQLLLFIIVPLLSAMRVMVVLAALAVPVA